MQTALVTRQSSRTERLRPHKRPPKALLTCLEPSIDRQAARSARRRAGARRTSRSTSIERRGVRMRCSASSTAARTAVPMRVKLARRRPSRLAATDSHTLAAGGPALSEPYCLKRQPSQTHIPGWPPPTRTPWPRGNRPVRALLPQQAAGPDVCIPGSQLLLVRTPVGVS
jgi:hypothetical protein